MISHEPTLSGHYLIDLLIVGTVLLSDYIYDGLLFLVTQEQIHDVLIDLKDVFGVVVALLGAYLMIIKIKKAKKR